MMDLIWGAMIVVSLISGMVTGKVDEVTNAAFSGAAEAVQLFLTLLGVITLWSGIMKIAERSGITQLLARLFAPLIRWLFPGVTEKSVAAQALSMNIAANLLGLGNAATPLGLTAIREMNKDNHNKSTATNDMITLVVMNTASIQLIPTTIAGMRAASGSAAPMEITVSVWLASAISLAAGLAVAALMKRIPLHKRTVIPAVRRVKSI